MRLALKSTDQKRPCISNRAYTLYELQFYHFTKHHSHSPLKDMVSPGYEDEFVITEDRIDETLRDLKRLAEVEGVAHPQIPLLCSVLREAASRKCGLAVAGDMYPDFSIK